MPLEKYQPDDLSPFIVHILSRESGKPALVDVVDFLARAEQSQSEPNKPTYQLSVDSLKTVMEGKANLSVSIQVTMKPVLLQVTMVFLRQI